MSKTRKIRRQRKQVMQVRAELNECLARINRINSRHDPLYVELARLQRAWNDLRQTLISAFGENTYLLPPKLINHRADRCYVPTSKVDFLYPDVDICGHLKNETAEIIHLTHWFARAEVVDEIERQGMRKRVHFIVENTQGLRVRENMPCYSESHGVIQDLQSANIAASAIYRFIQKRFNDDLAFLQDKLNNKLSQ
ncbi:hypothetical protein [Thiolinea disciformis]|uniref:hypothetical protein n=1 Tax=Thiolinea disciformis TaxID=125614 RepID=UPI0003768ECD|nr:hypothetical protein [Thiolinea disciformis]